MFSLEPTSPSAGKRKEHPLANEPLDKKGRKQAHQFVRGVKRFLRYNSDLLKKEQFANIEKLKAEFESSLNDPSLVRRDFEKKAEKISETCRKAVPHSQPSLFKENIEVLFVAVVIAMGIRAYFIQQFKIPTGSMQPTLNGIIAFPAPEIRNTQADYQAPPDYRRPGLAARLIDSIWFGRSHVEWIAKEDGDSIQFMPSIHANFENFWESNFLILFPRTHLTTQKGHRYSAPGTRSRVRDLIHYQSVFNKGDVIARGFIQTGDMLVVNKMIYHWRKPKRGEVFVFNTRDIRGIENSPSFDPRFGSQHYIKRLCGVPGDHIQIDPPQLIVNEQPAKEFGIQRVVASQGLYDGYKLGSTSEFRLQTDEYLALGDNSGSSFDSREWGPVKKGNIVGKALFVFYPFGNHFGTIR